MWRDQIPISVGRYLAAYVLWEVKNHVIYCGGDSIIYSLGDDGSFRYLNPGDIRDLEEHYSNIETAVSNVRLRTADLECSNETFAELVREFSAELTQLREIRLEKLKAENRLGEIRAKWPRIHNMDG